MDKFKKFIPLILLVIAALAILILTGNKDEEVINYGYEGYIIGMQNTQEGTVLTTLNGNTKSEFVVKRNTKATYNGTITDLQEGDYIKLNTTKNSDRDIKEFSAYSAFATEGKVFFAEGYETPLLLTPYYASYRVFSLIFASDSTAAPTTGTPVKVYYQYPINAATVTIVADGILATSESAELSAEEIAFLQKQAYTVTTP